MRLIVDAQLPPALCDWFRECALEAVHVRDVLGGQTPDRLIHMYVEQHALVLVTKDDDFLLRHPPIRSRLVWLRCGNITNRALRVWLETRWAMVEERLASGESVVEVR